MSLTAIKPAAKFGHVNVLVIADDYYATYVTVPESGDDWELISRALAKHLYDSEVEYHEKDWEIEVVSGQDGWGNMAMAVNISPNGGDNLYFRWTNFEV